MPTLILLLAHMAYAMKFDKPVIASDDSGNLSVTVSGTATPGTQFTVPSEELKAEVGSQFEVWPRSKVFADSLITTAKDDGTFRFSFTSPPATLYLPMVAISPKGRKRRLQLKLKIYDDSLQPEPEEEDLPPPSYLPIGSRISLAAGLGFNFLRMQQKPDNRSVNVNFQSFETPSRYLATRIKLSERTQMKLSYSSAPGRVKSEGKFTFDHTYKWDILAAETVIFMKERELSFLKYPLFIGTNFGVQQHRMPFLLQTASTTFEMRDNPILLGFLGGNLMQKVSKWIFEAYLRIQIPIQTGDVFEAREVFALDGALRAEYQINPRWSFATFWYGQYHQYKTTHTDPVVQEDVIGNLLLAFSTLEARLVYNF